MARPTKYTPIRTRVILSALKAGLTRTAASAKAGINLETLGEWVKRYPEFSGAVIRAEGEAEARFTRVIAQAANPRRVVETTTTTGPDGTVTKQVVKREFDWRAAESWLKRRRRNDWGDSQELRGPDGGPIPISVVEVRKAYADGDTETTGRD